jgi:hypothetical protein
MADHLAQRDLIAGGAAAALLLLVVMLGVTPLLAIPLAMVTYVGIKLRLPWRERDDDVSQHHLAYQAAIANAAAIRSLQRRIAKPMAREQVGRILERTALVLAVMREDGSLAAAPLFNEQLLMPFRSLLTEYVRLSTRGVRSADELLEKTETSDLALIEQAVDGFYERLHRSHMVDLATLREVIELNLERIAAVSTRRFTP